MLVTVGSPVAAQQVVRSQAVAPLVSRVELSALVDRLDAALRSPVYSDSLKARARAELEEARARLKDGDFQVGDRILLAVQGESTLTDTFTVAPGRQLQLKPIGTISLQGVLHAELQSYLKDKISQYVRNPRVQAHTLLRVAIDGAVARPGFYSVAAEGLLTDALMAAGGPSATAMIEKTRIERGGRELLTIAAVKAAVAQGITLDKLGVRAGDRILVPQQGTGLGSQGVTNTLRNLAYLVPLTVLAVTRLFKI
jgi:protein involved in polysaccharide export with SLBB domain